MEPQNVTLFGDRMLHTGLRWALNPMADDFLEEKPQRHTEEDYVKTVAEVIKRFLKIAFKCECDMHFQINER